MTNSYSTGPGSVFRKFLFVSLALTMSVLYSVSSWGQAATYNVATTTGTYTPITGGAVLFSGGGLDDGISASITIPSFTFSGTAYTVIRVNVNGWMSFGAATSGAVYTPLSSANAGASAVLAPFGTDQFSTATMEIRHENLTGSNEYVIQWKDQARYNGGTPMTGDLLNYQVRLNYVINTVQFVYGTMNRGALAVYPQIGIKSSGAAGVIGTTLQNLTAKNIPVGTSCTWADAVRGRLNTETLVYNSTIPNISVPSGLTYTWTPQTGTIVNPVTVYTAVASITTTGATIAWTGPTNATQYDVQYRPATSCSWTQFSTGQAGVSAVLTGLSSSTVYHVRVRARSATNNGAYSHIPPPAGGTNTDGYTVAGSFTTASPPPVITITSPTSNYCSVGGQTVVITGTDFVGVIAVTGVRFNGVNATSWVVNSATQITAVTPAGITAGNLLVQTAAGTSAGYAYTVNTNPTVGVNSPSVCGAYPTTLTATGASTYSWSPSTMLSASTGNPVTLTATGATAITVTGTDAFGCTGTAVSTVTYTAPTYVAITPSISQFCGAGGATTVTATSSNINYAYTFSVLQTGSLSNITANSADFTVAQTSAIRVNALDNVGLCAVNRDTAIGVLAFPTLTMAATPATICAGSTSVLSSGLTAGSFSVSSITYAATTAPAGAGVLMNNGVAVTPLSGGTMDDGGWGGVPIGFTFNYFGSPFTTLGAGTNGLLMFGTIPGYSTATGHLGQFTFVGGPTYFPNAGNPANVIALLAADMQMANSTSGSIRYWVEGYAPYRAFVINYQQVHGWSNNPAATVQCRLYETTGIVEVHLNNKTFANTAIIGLQNSTQTIGAIAPGRAGTWTTSTPEGWRFTPPSNYTTTWTPSGDISGSNTGTNLFTRTTNALSTPGANNFTLVAQDQTTGCTNGAGNIATVTVLATPPTVSASEISAYGTVLGVGSATTTSPLVICGNQSAVFTCTTTISGPQVVRWYTAVTGGTLLATNVTYTATGLTPGSYSIWAEVYNGICSSAARTQFNVTINTPPAVTINSLGPDGDTNCGVGPTYVNEYQASSANDPNYTYTWTNDGNALTFLDNGSGNADISTGVTTNSTVSAFDATTGCLITNVKPMSVYAFPSVTPTATDTILCVGDSTQVQSGVTQGNFSVACNGAITQHTPVGAVTLCSGGVANVALTSGSLDDGGWGAIPFGFNFDFFGTVYTNLNVGTNGVVQFGTYNGNGGFTLPYGLGDYSFTGFPSTAEPLNMIAVIACDLYMATTGTVRYWTEGVSPNRLFVLEYLNCPGFITNGTQSAQLHLHETTGLFDVYAAEATSTAAKTIGVNNSTGLIGATAQRCNAAPQTWSGNTATILSAFPWSWTFTPPVNYTFAWSPSGEISGSTTGSNIMAVPTSAVPTTQTYSLTVTDNVTGCTNAVPFTRDIEVIAVPSAASVDGIGSFSNVLSTNTINICGDQTVDLNVTNGSAGFTAHYYDDALLTNEVFLANPYSATYTTGTLSATDTLYVTLDNGSCEGPAQLVEIVMQIADVISISNDSPVNCGPGSYTGNFVASSTASYTYTWNASPVLSTLSGPSTTATPVIQTTVFVVNGDDGFCYTSASTSMSVYDFPTVTPTTSVDSICPGGSAVFYANVDSTNFTVASQGYSPQSLGTPVFLVQSGVEIVPQDINNFGLIDDGGWFNIPIGFTYNFFGNNYTTCNISTNGNIQFGPTGGFSTSFSPGAVPSVAVPNNFVAACWGDLNLEEPVSSLRYQTTGTAPNRVFSVLWDCEFYPGANSTIVTAQAELYETTGNVEVHIQNVTNPNFQPRVVGVEDLTGTIGALAPGHASGDYFETTGPEGWLFTPPHDYSFDWDMDADINGSDILDTVVAQPVALTGTVMYVLNVTDNQTTCTNQYNIPLIVSTAPPVANFGASPLVGTSGGVYTTHTMNNTSTDISGVTYAWTWAPNTVTYVNGTTASSKNPQVQFNNPGNYSPTLVVTTCNGTDSQTNTNYITITPEYCFPSWSIGCVDDMIDGVIIQDPTLATIMSHTGTGCNGTPSSWDEYAPIAAVTSCTFYQGSTYSVTVNSAAIFPEYFGLWMDVNNDGDFADAGEFMGGNAVSAITATFSIGIASDGVIYGAHRMRVIADYSAPLLAGDYCNVGTWGEGHDYTVYVVPPVQPNDIPTFATSVAYSSNQNFPNCYPINGSTALATNSPESATFTGNDVWYRFTAQSTAVSITVTSLTFDDAISLYQKIGNNYVLMTGGNENASSGAGDFERLNYSGLTPATQYWVSVGSVNNASSGAFTICIQHLMPSWCAYVIPGGGFGLCDAYKAIYRGSPTQGATYNFNFTGTGGTAPLVTTAITGTNGLTTLSQAVLALRYGGIYNASVDVVYTLNPSAGAPEAITVIGSISSPNCTGVTIRPEPQIEVKLSQRCPATLLRSNYLIGTPITGNPNACTATGFTYRFTSVASCGDITGLGTTYNTVGNTPYLQLGNLPLLGLNVGIWRVEIRPNFSYGNGSFGPSQWIQVNGTAVSPMLNEEGLEDNSEKSMVVSIDANLYPNPNNGEMVNLNVSGVESDNVFVRILDATGRVVYTNRFTVEGSLNTIVTFAQPLAGGLYNVEFTVDGQVMTERMMVTK